MQRPSTSDNTTEPTRHKRPAIPIHFPSEATAPETKRHLELRTLLYAILKEGFANRAHIGSEQFVYFVASDPKRCVAPDAFVRLGGPDDSFDTWKTWERGAPELCVEIASDSDAREWARKLEAYHALGVSELVLFDADAPEGSRVRVWDRVEGDLVERVVEGDRAACRTLEATWVVRPEGAYPFALRLADAAGELLPTRAEAAQRRIAELEAELARRG
jgi:Uma2 family endonuclease